METFMNLNNLKQTCQACPSQWEAISDDDREVYVHYRWGYLQVWLADKSGDDALCGEQIYSAQLGDSLDGILEEDKMLEIISGLQG
jgi:hypothetical protein